MPGAGQTSLGGLPPPAEPSKDSRALVCTALRTSATEAVTDQRKPRNLKQRQKMTTGMLARLGQLTASKSTLGSWAPEGREPGQLKGPKSRNYGSDSLGRGRCQGTLSSRCGPQAPERGLWSAQPGQPGVLTVPAVWVPDWMSRQHPCVWSRQSGLGL